MRGEGKDERDEMNRRGHTEYAKCSTGTVFYRHFYCRNYNIIKTYIQYVDFRLGFKENYIFPQTLAALNF